MKKMILSLAYILFLGLSSSWSQTSCVCVYFESTNNRITIEMNKDSTYTHFSILKKGYEDSNKRQRILDSLKQAPPGRWSGFFMDYFALGKPCVIKKDDMSCNLFLSLKKFRYHNYSYEKIQGKPQIVFLKRIANNHFLKWNVQLQIKL